MDAAGDGTPADPWLSSEAGISGTRVWSLACAHGAPIREQGDQRGGVDSEHVAVHWPAAIVFDIPDGSDAPPSARSLSIRHPQSASFDATNVLDMS